MKTVVCLKLGYHKVAVAVMKTIYRQFETKMISYRICKGFSGDRIREAPINE